MGKGGRAASRTAAAARKASQGGGTTVKDQRMVDFFSRRIYGRELTAAEYRQAVGADSHARVIVSTAQGELKIEVKGPGYRAFRTIKQDAAGQAYIRNDFFQVSKKIRQQGLGTQIFSRQVEGARKLGFTRIATEASRGRGLNGYYTWARIGYDANLVASDRRRLPAGLKGATRVSDLMKTAEGRAWWKAKGSTYGMVFDLKTGSRSMRALEGYRREKGL